MHLKKILLAVLLVDLAAVTVYAGYAGTWDGVMSMLALPWGMQVGLDLAIAIGLAAVWVWRDARERDLNPLPYVLLMAVGGSLGLLVYLLRRPAYFESSVTMPSHASGVPSRSNA